MERGPGGPVRLVISQGKVRTRWCTNPHLTPPPRDSGAFGTDEVQAQEPHLVQGASVTTLCKSPGQEMGDGDSTSSNPSWLRTSEIHPPASAPGGDGEWSPRRAIGPAVGTRPAGHGLFRSPCRPDRPSRCGWWQRYAGECRLDLPRSDGISRYTRRPPPTPPQAASPKARPHLLPVLLALFTSECQELFLTVDYQRHRRLSRQVKFFSALHLSLRRKGELFPSKDLLSVLKCNPGDGSPRLHRGEGQKTHG